jgi:uncharacterized membrane protein
MRDTKNEVNAIKWFVTIVASIVFIASSIVRIKGGQDVDDKLCWVFIVTSGLVWGANFVNYFKKKE